MFSMPSGMELFMIVLVILVLFGGRKIPELAKGLGLGIKNFRNELKEEDEINKTSEVKVSASTTDEKIS
jgi:sec-independent protein translocase protein TatA